MSNETKTSTYSRKKIDFDWVKLNEFLKTRPSLSDASELMGCSEDTIERRIRKEHDLTFAEYRDKKLADIRKQLVSTALEMALYDKNKTMLIFCLKNLCGWSDNVQLNEDNKDQRVFKLSYSIHEEKKDEKNGKKE